MIEPYCKKINKTISQNNREKATEQKTKKPQAVKPGAFFFAPISHRRLNSRAGSRYSPADKKCLTKE
jgi:hypothetical protein